MSVNISDVLEIVSSQNQWRGKETINLIASENVQSDAVKQVEVNDFMGRYAEGHPNTAQEENRYYEGTRYIDQIESMATMEIIKLSKSLQADVRPVSGNAANTAVALAVLRGNDTVIANSMTGTFEFEKGDKREMPDFNVFYKYNATYPFYSDAVWFLTQMRRWGQIPESKTDEWYQETAAKIYRPDIWKKAAEMLVAEGKIPATDIPETDGYKAPTADFIDGIEYDGKKPNEYLTKFEIGNKDQ